MSEITILITTYNRKEELKFTLRSLTTYLKGGEDIIICDDGSNDGTSEFIKKNYPHIHLLVNKVNKGLISSRNLLMSHVKTSYAISLDDDANFLSLDPFNKILKYFEREPTCGVIAFRISWGIKRVKNIKTNESSKTVKSYVGCGHVWRMKTWKDIANYPEWYQFYGEENFASLQLFKKQWRVHYLPSVMVQHRVDNTARKRDEDFYLRARRSLRADWYNYVIFYPKGKMIRIFFYSVKTQMLKAIDKRDFNIIKNLVLALGDVLTNLNKLIKNRNSLSHAEYKKWTELPNAKIYWKPELTHKIKINQHQK